MRVKRIVAQNIGNASNRRITQENVAKCEVHWEIEQSAQSCVDAVVAFLPTREKRRDAGVRVKNFTDRRQARIYRAQTRMPVGPKFAANVRESVDAIAVKAGALRPPDGVLEKILGNDRVFCVHVGDRKST